MKYPQDRIDAYRSADKNEEDALEAYKLGAIPTS
jgi:hypothetical protein